MLWGMPTLRAIDVAATASVGETTAPSRNPSRQSNPGSHQRAANATPTAVKKTRNTARLEMDTRLYLNSRHDVCQAAIYNSGGRNTRNTIEGGRGILGTRGMSEHSRPNITSAMGYESPKRRANPATAAIANSNAIS